MKVSLAKLTINAFQGKSKNLEYLHQKYHLNKGYETTESKRL